MSATLPTQTLGYFICIHCQVSTPVKNQDELDLAELPKCIDCNKRTQWSAMNFTEGYEEV